MEFDNFKLVVILAGSLLVGSIGLLFIRGSLQRIMLCGILGGLIFYSGIGGADLSVPTEFVWIYFGFYLSVVVGFCAGRPFVGWIGARVSKRLTPVYMKTDAGEGWRYIVWLYLGLSIVPLVWPEMKLGNLFSPQAPDLGSMFLREFVREPDPVTKLLNYVRLVLAPFFYIGLYYYKNNLRAIFAIFALLVYLEYSVNSYVGRSTVMLYLGTLFLAVWFLRPEHQKKMLFGLIVTLPSIFYAFYLYQLVRLGGEVVGISLFEAMQGVLQVEWGFPKDVGVPIITSGKHVDLGGYFAWIFTLPIPKIFTGPIDGARINYEISTVVLGLPAGVEGWYVVLPGLVAESVYIFGVEFFWIHGVCIGLLAVITARALERMPQTVFLQMNIVLVFGYVLNRAGIGGVLPILVNQLFVPYLIILLLLSLFGQPARRRGLRFR
jgi:hypothetical protein